MPEKSACLITQGRICPADLLVQSTSRLASFRPALTKRIQYASHHRGMYNENISHAAGVHMTSEVQGGQAERLS